MATIDFPSGATTGTVFTATNSVVYIFDGIKWTGQGVTSTQAVTGDGGNASSFIRSLASLDGGNA